MKKAKGIIWGIVIVALGILWGLKEANILNYSMFFDGWWTLFIIVPSIIGLVTEKNKKGSLICLAVGVLLLVNCYFDLWQYKRYLLPLIIVIVGASVIVGNIFDKKPEYQQVEQYNPNPQNQNESANANYGEPVYIPQGNQEYYASFTSEDYRFDNGFAGGKFCATFGGLKLDIRNADIVHNCVINTNATFGGIEIYVPQDVRVVVKSNSVFGGTSDKSNKNLPPDAKTVFVNATNLFGGTDIK
ncbi:MAG: LiaF-related protein [Clostridia bacterium]|nr:LiaF-related protein [Clostridia bacterium]